MALSLADFADAPTEAGAPLLPIADDAILQVSASLTLAVCKRGTGEPVLARFKAGNDGKNGKPVTEDSWRQSARVADIARAIAGGLLA